MNVCPICGAVMDMDHIVLEPHMPISRVLNVLLCTDREHCNYWVPCSTNGKAPMHAVRVKSDEVE